MLARFRKISQNQQGNVVLEYADEAGTAHRLVIARGALNAVMAAIVAEAGRLPETERTFAHPVIAKAIFGASGPNGFPGFGFALERGYIFPVLFEPELLKEAKEAVATAEQLMGQRPDRLV